MTHVDIFEPYDFDCIEIRQFNAVARPKCLSHIEVVWVNGKPFRLCGPNI